MQITSFKLDNQFQQDLKKTVFPEIGAKIVKTYTEKLDQRCRGDYRIHWRGKNMNIDIKAEQDTPNNFFIEISQDWQSNDTGWLYTLCCDVLYGRYIRGNLKSVYFVSLPSIKAIDASIAKTFQPKTCTQNYGNTVGVAAPLKTLVNEGVAELIWCNKNMIQQPGLF